MSETPAPALKEIFNRERFQHIAREMAALDPKFEAKRFLTRAVAGLDELSLLQRLRRMTECLHEELPSSYPRALSLLRRLAPKINSGFVTLVLPDYVALYGLEHFDASMAALKFFTPFGSSEFAIREFLRRDLSRTLAVMTEWSLDADEAVRRLASEGSRPRLPWSFRLEALIADPSPTRPILENLRGDSSLYVRKSVANHLNDITKDHPTRVMDWLEGWPLENKLTAWIAKHALRTLIKKGDRRALALIGAGAKPEVVVHDFRVRPQRIRLGERIELSFQLESKAKNPQRLVVDYVVHYVKKSGETSGKVFKWKELALGPGEKVAFARSQVVKDFTTRVHHAGRHAVEILVNGENLAQDSFDLARE